MIDFPLPILSVSPDVVKDLDGEDALYGMWTGVYTLFLLIYARYHDLSAIQSSQNARSHSRMVVDSRIYPGGSGTVN